MLMSRTAIKLYQNNMNLILISLDTVRADVAYYDGPRKLNSGLRLYNTMNYGSKYTAGSPASIQSEGSN